MCTIRAMTTTDPKATWELVTPERAKELLANNSINRSVRQSTVDRMALAMKRGEWLDQTGATIGVDINGELLDAQHRLLACVKSGHSFRALVITGLDPAIRRVTDVGAARTASDNLHMEGESHAAVLAAACGIVHAWEVTGHPVAAFLPPAERVTPTRVLDTLHRHPDLRLSVHAGGTTKSVFVLTRSMVTALHYIFSIRGGGELADEFFEGLCSGAMLAPGDPALTLRERLAKMQQGFDRPSPTAITAITVRAWNAFVRGQPLVKLMIARDTSPGALRTNFPTVEAPR